jgi:hypothetical protein
LIKDGSQDTGAPAPLSAAERAQLPRFGLDGLRSAEVLLSVVAIAPALIALGYVLVNGVSVPYWDEWDEAVRQLLLFKRGALPISSLFSQHNEHRIPITRLVMLLLDSWSGFDLRVEMLVSWVALAGIFALVSRELVRNSADRLRAIAAIAPVGWVIFSLRQSENLLWGFQIGMTLSVLGVVGAIVLLDARQMTTSRLASAAACAFVASFSFFSGLLVWPVGAIQLLCARQRRRRWHLFLWCVLALITFVVYFADYHKPGHHPPLTGFLRKPEAAIMYALVSVGQSMATDVNGAFGFGALLLAGQLVALAHLLWGARQREISPIGTSLMLFALATTGSLVVGRSPMGIEQALSSRYATITGLGVVGLYLFCLECARARRPGSVAAVGAVVALIGVGAVSTLRTGFREGRVLASARRELAYILKTHAWQNDATLAKLYPLPANIRPLIQELQIRRWSVFSSQNEPPKQLARLPATTAHAIDTVNERAVPVNRVVEVEAKSTVRIAGWAVDSEARRPAAEVWVSVGDKELPTLHGGDRPDVARALKQPASRHSGFEAVFSAEALGVGRHVVSFMFVSHDRRGYYPSGEPLVLVVR